MQQSDNGLLYPGIRVRIGTELKGNELYEADDPEEYEKWLGKEVTVATIEKFQSWMVTIEEDKNVCFFIEEIECIVDIPIIEESSAPISMLLGIEV